MSIPQEKLLKLSRPLYCITSEQHSNGRPTLEVAGQMVSSGAGILQYREKDKSKAVKYEECLFLRRMCAEKGVTFIVNDDIDIAMAVKADGVHIGQDDLPLKAARELLGERFIIGVSTHSPDQAEAAVSGGADYIGVGPIYATRTKNDVCPAVGLEYLRYVARSVHIPFVAIGGIKLHNLPEVISAGAKCVAMVTEITSAVDIEKRVGDILALMRGI